MQAPVLPLVFYLGTATTSLDKLGPWKFLLLFFLLMKYALPHRMNE